MMTKLKDPVSALTHMLGALLSTVGTVVLLYKATVDGGVRHIVSFAIFGTSLILLYTASSVYHAVPTARRWTRILRKLDHSMIYVLIAGTYTPMCLVALYGGWRWGLLSSVWALSLIGIALKIVWLDTPRWLSTLSYAFLGWLIVIASANLVNAITPAGMMWLAAGGLFYTIGAIIYGTKWPRFKSPSFGFHEVFHLFVLGGSIAHYWLMLGYVLPIP